MSCITNGIWYCLIQKLYILLLYLLSTVIFKFIFEKLSLQGVFTTDSRASTQHQPSYVSITSGFFIELLKSEFPTHVRWLHNFSTISVFINWDGMEHLHFGVQNGRTVLNVGSFHPDRFVTTVLVVWQFSANINL